MDKTNGRPESSATSPDVSPRHSTATTGRHNVSQSWNMNGDGSSQHKRQRSISSEQGPPSPRRYDYNPPKKIETQQQHMADRALHVLDTTTDQHPHSSYYPTVPNAQDNVYGYERPYSGPPGAHSSTPEGRLAEAFERQSSEHHYASSANEVDHERFDDIKDESQGPQAGQKRKRNFSNRTKTGCITCRSRKKKCDEGRPHCNNCVRGGFACQGYNHTRPSTWAKPTPQKQPILLQSKENDEQSPYENTMTPVSANPSGAEASQVRPNVADSGHGHDQSRPQYVPNSSNPTDSRPSYSGQQQHQPQWPQHPPQHAHHPVSQSGHPPQTPYPSDNLPSVSELPRPEHSQQYQHQQQQAHPPPQHYQHHQRPEYSTTPSREMSRPPTQAHSVGPSPSAPSAPPQSQHQTHPPPQWQQPPAQQQPPHQQQPPPQQPTQQPPQHQPTYHPPPQQQDYPARPPYPPRIDTTSSYPPTHRLNTANTATPALTTANTNTAVTATPYSTVTASSLYEPKNTSTSSSRTFTMEDVERSKMLRGAPYNYFDATLKNERQRCANALLRYNNACQLGSGVSEPELQNMLSKVFLPSKDSTHSFVASLKGHEGSLGPGVRIEPGFRCTYGYNIKIYDNVFIGENTRIDDSARVDIGARTWIGADVTILTNEPKVDLVGRKGTDGGLCSAAPVSIGSEVIVGAGAVIYPGVKLGKGSTVEPFAVVKSDLPDLHTRMAAVGPTVGNNGSTSW
ncbi:hypothetical protein OHC33_009749 [Knufia fluminis]|uniref:Zn(2)-C6 fungal-type domain-containing protein n=1 Tax=Knufia fluminis TaxID=191047 RepID=A0AAN8EDZ2_9EURO|nr:hypothetical protein OHC33_009749 [Knufia fluminis]